MRVRDLQDGSRVSLALLLRKAYARPRADGSEYLRLELGDRSGTLPAFAMEPSPEMLEASRPGTVVHVTGLYSTHTGFGPRLLVESIRQATEGEYDRHDLIDGPARSAVQMEADLRELVATIQDPDLRRLLAELFDESTETWARFREAPAAKHYHQAFRHGLLEHCLTVAQAVSAISATFPGIDRDVAVTGALVHDIGKLDAYELDGDAIEMSDQGRLYGEIPLGYHRVRTVIESLDGFPPATAQAVLHIILSHHGSLEHGSPVVPCTREATLVHMIDNLGGRLGSFDRLERGLAAGEQWSAYDKGIGAGAFFASPPPSLEIRAA